LGEGVLTKRESDILIHHLDHFVLRNESVICVGSLPHSSSASPIVELARFGKNKSDRERERRD